MDAQLAIDLRGDCIENFRSDLADMGYKVADDGDKILCLYHKIAVRTLIRAKPRIVRVSSNFTCPEEYNSGLRNLRRAFIEGEDLLPFMSKRVKKNHWRDYMLDYWRIHHFHLGDRIEEDGFVGRTRHILMAFVDWKYAYFIGVEDHSKDKDPWYKKRLLTVLHENWPEAIAHARLHGVTAIHNDHCDEDIKQLRRAGVSNVYKIGEAFYMEPGFGLLGDGTHIDDRRFADKVLLAAESIQKEVLRDWTSIRDAAAKQGFSLEETATLSLRDIFLWETHRIGAPIHVDVGHLDIMDSETGYWFRRYAPPR